MVWCYADSAESGAARVLPASAQSDVLLPWSSLGQLNGMRHLDFACHEKCSTNMNIITCHHHQTAYDGCAGRGDEGHYLDE